MQKKKQITALLMTFAICFALVLISLVSLRNNEIERVLETDAYAYLPEEAKDLVRQNYYETGEIILTEKNAIEDQPFLSPDYIAYISANEEEKKELYSTGYIPNIYTVTPSEKTLKNIEENILADTNEEQKETTSLKSYRLDDIDGDSYITPFKNQYDRGFCWAFSTSEIAESYAMINLDKTPYSAGTTTTISPYQLHYASAVDTIKGISKNPFAYTMNTELGFRRSQNIITTNKYGGYTLDKTYDFSDDTYDGGNFYLASTVASRGISLADESKFGTFTKQDIYSIVSVVGGGYFTDLTVTYTDPRSLADTLSFKKSAYEINETIELGQTTDAETLESYKQIIKDSIVNYGGAFVASVSPKESGNCATLNTNGDYIADKTGNCSSRANTHAMTIIGWDDDYKMEYCLGPNNTFIQATSDGGKNTCSGEDPITTTGAWIVRNSWGDVDAKISYLSYRSVQNEFGIINNMTKTEDREWDNFYYDETQTSNGYLYRVQDIIIETKENITETPTELKILSDSPNAEYTIYAYDSNDDYIFDCDPITATANKVGITTIDLSSWNYLIEGKMTITIVSTDWFRPWSTTVFTKNVEDEKYINSSSEQFIELGESDGEQYTINNYYDTRNIDSGDELKIRILTTNEDNELITLEENKDFEVNDNTIAANNALVEIKINDDIEDGVYSIITYVGNIDEEIDPTETAFVINYFVKGDTPTATFNYSAEENGFVTSESETISSLAYITDKTIPQGSEATANDGYQFTGWQDSSENIIAIYEDCEEDTCPYKAKLVPSVLDETFYPFYVSEDYLATFEEEKAKITYKVQIDDGEKSDEYADAKLTIETEEVGKSTGIASGSTASIVEKDGSTDYSEYYNFVGWKDPNGTIISTQKTFVPSKSESGIYEDATYTAIFEIIKTTLNINVSSEENKDFGMVENSTTLENIPYIDISKLKVNSSSFVYDNVTYTAIPLENTERYSYSFVQWNKTANVSGSSIIAEFSRTANQYVPTTKVNNSEYGSISGTLVAVDYGTEITENESQVTVGSKTITAIPTTATAQYNYKFNSWQFTGCVDEENFPSKKVITSTCEITANFDREIRKYTVTFNPDNGADQFTLDIEYGNKISEPSNITKQGYDLISWKLVQNGEETIAEPSDWNFANDEVHSNITLKANWEIRKVHITFMLDEETEYKVYNQDFGTIVDVTDLGTPTMEHYTFSGWDKDIPETFPEEDIVITAKWIEKTVVYSFTANEHGTLQKGEATGDEFEQSVLVITGELETITALPDTGYHFSGWRKVGGQEFVSTEASFVPEKTGGAYKDEGESFEAIFEANTYTVSFDGLVDGISIQPASIEKKYNELIGESEMPEPSSESLMFGGWYKDSSFNDPWDNTTDHVTDNTTLYARWIAIVRFDLNGYGDMMPNDNFVTYGEKIPALSTTPSDDNYDFAGWFKEEDCQNEWNFEIDVVSEHMTLYAKWTPKVYTITINVAEDSTSRGTVSQDTIQAAYNTYFTISNNTLTFGDTTITAISNEETAQFTFAFDSWNASACGVNIKSHIIITNECTIYASFTETTREYDVNFETNGGSEIETQTIKYGEKVTTPTTTKKNYKLLGWFKDSEYTEEWNFDSNMIEGETTLYAAWELLPGELIINPEYIYDSLNKIMRLPLSETNEDVVENIQYKINGEELEGITINILASDATTKLEEGVVVGTGTYTQVLGPENEVIMLTQNIILGDVDGDGDSDSIDHSIIKSYIMKKDTLSESYFFAAADYDNNNIVNAQDYVNVKYNELN